MIIFFLRQPETKAVLTFVFSVVILILSANSILIPYAIWLWVSSSIVRIVCCSFVVISIMRWLAAGGKYSDIDSMTLDGKTFLITGAASGIGRQTAIELVKRNARVILFARPANLNMAIQDMKKYSPTPNNVTGYPIDLADLRSIQNCVEQFMKSESEKLKITALINNAGVMACPYGKTKDGFELQMGTNHFGHFYFTQLLLPRLHSSRIINVSSAAHAVWVVPCNATHYERMCNPNTYHPFLAYSLSKTANILFTRELQKRYSITHNIRAYSLHPGTVNTPLDRHFSLNRVARALLKPIRYIIFKSLLEGTQTTLFCALSNEAKPGEYHADCKATPMSNKYAEDDRVSREWWDYSETMIEEKLKQL